MIAAVEKRNAFAVQNAKLADHRFEASAIARRRDHDIRADQIAIGQDHAMLGKFPHRRKSDDFAGLNGLDCTVVGRNRDVLRREGGSSSADRKKPSKTDPQAKAINPSL